MGEEFSDKKTWVHPLCDRQYVIDEDEQFSIAYVGDMHLHHNTPKSRVDDYPSTCIEKLSILRRELKARGIKYLVCPGDIYHIPKERTEFEYATIQEFMKFRQEGIKVFISVGNHDIANERMENIEKSSLGILFLSGAVCPFTKVTFNRKGKTPVVLTGLNFPNDPEPVTEFKAYNILACHKFYNVNLDKDSIMKEDLEKLGYNMYLCNHDHVPYDLVKEQTSQGIVSIVRPGSFMRGTSHGYNTDRLVYMDEIHFNGKVEVIRHTLPVRDPKDIFPASVTDKLENISLRDISAQMSELVNNLYTVESSGNSVYKILDASPVEPDIKGRIEEYLVQFGIYRDSVVESELDS